jgi:hypothetical protein
MDLQLRESLDRPDPLRVCLRPLSIWLGLATFLGGSILLGSTLASPNADPFAGPLLLLVGVALVGGGFTMEPTDLFPDPEVAFTGSERYFGAAVSVLFVLLAGAVLVLAAV